MSSSHDGASKQLKLLQQFTQSFAPNKTTVASTNSASANNIKNEIIINKQSLATSSIRPTSQTNTTMPSSSSLRSNDLVKIMQVQNHIAAFRMDPVNQMPVDQMDVAKDATLYCQACSLEVYPEEQRASKILKCERKEISDEKLKEMAFRQAFHELSVSSTDICISTIQNISELLLYTVNIGTVCCYVLN